MSWRPVMGIALIAALSGEVAAASAPQQPEQLAQIRRELRIGADVLYAAFGEAFPEAERIVAVDAGYLSNQGVLVVVDLASPWFDGNDWAVEVDPALESLEHVPDMLNDILAELNLGLTQHQVEELGELREIRRFQRGARAEQRALRAERRAALRELKGSDDAAAVSALEQRISRLDERLQASEREEHALEGDANVVRDTLEPSRPAIRPVSLAPADIDRAVAETVCRYGSAFKSLAATQHLNVVVRRGTSTRYLTFVMADIRGCESGAVTSMDLLEASFGYQ